MLDDDHGSEPAGTCVPRRTLLIAALLAPAAVLAARRALPPRSSPIRWAGPQGRTLHGFMSIPARARGRQSAVLVIGEAEALPPAPDPAARAMVEEIAGRDLLACTADNLSNLPDLAATVEWLRFNRLATGRVAVVALGSGRAAAIRLAAAMPASIQALVLLGDGGTQAGSSVPALALSWRDGNPPPADAIAFLKEHLA